MKMKSEHYERLSALLDNLETPKGYEHLLAHYLGAGLSEKKFRWDCLWRIPRDERESLINELHTYMDDDHIDTALRKYFRKWHT